MVREVEWRRVAAMGLSLVLGALSDASAQAPAVNPEEAYKAETEIQIEGANPWGAVLISGGRELLVAERQASGVAFSIRDAATGRELRRLRARSIGWYPLWAISADGSRLVLGVVDSGQNALVIIDVATDQEIRRFPVPGNRTLGDVAISSDASRVAAIGHSFLTRVYVWETESGGVLQEIKADAASATGRISLNRDGSRVLVAAMFLGGGFSTSWIGLAEVWDTGSGRRVTNVELKDGGFNGAIFSPDGTHFITANRGGAKSPDQVTSSATLWEVATGRQVRAIGPGEGAAMGLSLSADGARIATVSADRRVRIWDAATGGLIGVLPAQGASGQGLRLEVAPGAFVQLSESSVSAVAPVFALEGTSLVTSQIEGVVKVWVDAAEKQVADKAALTANLAAAQGGDAEAMYRLALAYRDGRGVERNDALATQWLTQAADGGHGPANLELANALLSGDAGRQDCVAGGERLRKAVASGSSEASAQLDSVLAPLGGRDGAAALAPQIQADLLEAQIIEVLTRQEYPAFLANLCALEALGHADRLPIEARLELVYHRAAGLRAAGKPRAALAALNQYLNEAGNAGANYTQAIQMLRPLQEEAK
jgi:TPR repeat protein